MKRWLQRELHAARHVPRLAEAASVLPAGGCAATASDVPGGADAGAVRRPGLRHFRGRCRAGGELFPDVEHLVVPNLTHVVAYTYSDVAYLPDGGDLTHCVQKVIRRFVAQLSLGDATCIPKVRPIRTVPQFARTADDLAPVEARAGNTASPRELRLAAAALETVGDVLARFYVTFGIGSGLRGGEFTYTLQPFGQDFELESREVDRRRGGVRHHPLEPEHGRDHGGLSRCGRTASASGRSTSSGTTGSGMRSRRCPAPWAVRASKRGASRRSYATTS